MNTLLDPGYWLTEDLLGLGFNSVGERVRLSKLCQVVGAENIDIGDNVRIDAFTSLIAHSGFIRLGSFIHIGTNCILSGRGGITVEGFNAIGHGSRIFTTSDDFSGGHLVSCEAPEHVLNITIAPVRLGHHAILTTGCTVLPGASLADGAVAAAHSVVTRPLAEWAIHGGTPATYIKARSRTAQTLGSILLA